MATQPLLCASCLINGSKRLRQAILTARPEGHAFPTFSPTVRSLVHHVSQLGNMPTEDILSHNRAKRCVTLRKAISWVAGKATQHSYPMIGKVIGGRDHSTMIHARRSAENLYPRDPDFAWLCERLWAAGECQPLEPSTMPEPEPPELEVATEIEIPPAPSIPTPKVRIHESEYLPRHALPPVMAVDDDCLETVEAEPDRYSPVLASKALLEAIRREFPERFPRRAA